MRPAVAIAVAIVLATAATLASSMVPMRVTVRYAEILGCEQGCEVAAGGWPWPYLVDYPGLSPVGSVGLVGGLLGLDHLHGAALLASFAAWLVVSIAIVGCIPRR